MYLDDLIPVADSKRVNQVVRKIFGYNINLESLDVKKAKSLKENFTKQIKTLETKLGSRCESNQTYLQLKLVNEVLDKHIVENDMSDEANELVRFGENDADLYRQRTVPIMKNLTKKWDRGVYDHDLAVKLWTYWAADAAQRYSAEHGSPDVKWSNMFPTSVRNEVAEYMADYWEEELEAGNKMESASPVSEEGPYGIEDSNHEIVMGFVNQWIEAGQPDDYMDDLIAYVKKTIPDSKDWKYAASLIKNGVKSYQNREYGTSSLMGLRNNTESVEVTQENIIVEGEIETAEVVMAAKNVVDRIQGMIEDLGEILNEDLPPLTDTIRDQMDSTQAQSYYDSVSSAIMSALEAMRVSREAADGAARSIAGEQGAETMGAEPEVPEVPVEEPADDEFGASAAAAGGEEPLGRAEQV
jgi:hypothetical protein